MRKNLYSKRFITTVLVAMLAFTTGCDNSVDNANQQHVESKTTEESVYMTTEGFYPLSSIVEEYEFEKMSWADDITDSSYDKLTFTGEYSLEGKQTDKIEVYVDVESGAEYIDINGQRKEIAISDLENVAIIDMDENDEYKEVALYDYGPSADPSIIIYRYSENVIYEIGSFYGIYDYNNVLFDKKGKIIAATGYIDFIETQIVTEYYQVKDNEAKNVAVDSSAVMDKKYKLSTDMTVAFAETEIIDFEEAYSIINSEELLELKQGEEILLIKADPEMRLYYVQLPDGRRGVFTTQLAG